MQSSIINNELQVYRKGEKNYCLWSTFGHAETPPQDNAYEAESRRGVGVAARPGTPLA